MRQALSADQLLLNSKKGYLMARSVSRRRLAIGGAATVVALSMVAGWYVANDRYDDPTHEPVGGVPSPAATLTEPAAAIKDDGQMSPDPATVGVKPGDVLDAPVAGPVAEPGLKVAPLVDGTYLVVDPSAPLPSKVVDSFVLDASAAVNGTLGAPDTVADQTARLEQLSSYLYNNAGRWPVVVMRADRLLSASPGSDDGWVGWGRVGTIAYTTRVGTQDAVVAEINDWAAEQDTTDGFEVLVLP